MTKQFVFEDAYREYGPWAHQVVQEEHGPPIRSLTAVVYEFWNWEKNFYIPPRDAFRSVLRYTKQGRLAYDRLMVALMEDCIPNELR